VLTVLGRLPDAHPSRLGRDRTANPARIILTRTDLRRANLREMHLEGADLCWARLEAATLFGAQLEGANLAPTDLRRAILTGAQLQGANLAGAQLQGANLAGAQLQGADLGGTQLQGANLAGAQLQGAIADAETIWPSGFNWRAAGVQALVEDQTARGHGPEPLLAAYDPGQPYLQWTCALCPHQEFWPGDLEPHTAQQHPGWTATFEIVRPYPRQRLRVVYRRSGGSGSDS
jgi:hypothetical protein